MKKFAALALLAMALTGLPGLAAAQPQLAQAAKDAHLRAGPARDYPVVAILSAGSEVWIQGCLRDYSWCDVVAGPYRGWVYAANIVSVVQGEPVPVRSHGAEIGVVVVSFFLFDYWNDYYHDRPFFHERDRWLHRPLPPRRLPPRAVHPEPPVHGGPGSRPAPPPGHPGEPRPHPQPPQDHRGEHPTIPRPPGRNESK